MTLRNPRFTLCLLTLFLLAPYAFAVPGPLDDAHKALNHLYSGFVRYEKRFDRSMPYIRTSVRYPALGETNAWKHYIKSLIRYDGSKIKTAPREDQKAFWINTYNSLVINGVIEAYPLPPAPGESGESVRSLPDFFTRDHPVAGGMVSLNDIEHTLRGLHDPRVWLAINRGAVSSPPLPEKAFNPTDLDSQLNAAVENFLADPLRFRIDREKNQVVLSGLFLDRADEFAEAGISIPATLGSYPAGEKAVLAFILPRIRPQDRKYIEEKKPRVTYEPFDWALNLTQ